VAVAAGVAVAGGVTASWAVPEHARALRLAAEAQRSGRASDGRREVMRGVVMGSLEGVS
jgi:hypothetical protein